jgi:hypothetical protein
LEQRKMAKWQTVPRKALVPIPRVVDNTDAMAIRQYAITMAHVPIRSSDQPGGPGTFSPYSNVNFR